MFRYLRHPQMIKKSNIVASVNDIRTWIILFFCVRLVGITNAPLEIGHSWRQSLTNMMTRNLYMGHTDFIHPMIDMAGEKTGIIGAEFPLFNGLTYLLQQFTGYDHWQGRLINLLVSSIGIYFFYRLIWALFNKKLAFSASFLLLVSIWFGFSRKIMPDTFSVSLLLIALFYAYEFLIRGQKRHLALYFLLATLGILCKLPALVYFSVFIVLPFVKSIASKRKWGIYTSSLVATALAFTWYFVWVPELNRLHDFPLFFPRGIAQGFQLALPLWQGFLSKFYFDSFFAYTAFVIFLVGIYFLWKRANKLLLLALGTFTVIFLIFALKTGIVFPTHSYYIIPFVPLMALIGGLALEKISNPYAAVVLVLITVESVANQQHDFFIKDSEKYKLSLSALLDTYTNRADKIVINGGTSPQHIYFANRKGWTNDSEIINTKIFLERAKTHGAKLVVWDKRANIPFHTTSALLYEDENYQLYELK